MAEERFNSKIDWWLAALVALPIGRVLWIVGNGIADGRTPRVGGWVIISPKDKQGFADAIVRRGVNVQVEGLS